MASFIGALGVSGVALSSESPMVIRLCEVIRLRNRNLRAGSLTASIVLISGLVVIAAVVLNLGLALDATRVSQVGLLAVGSCTFTLSRVDCRVASPWRHGCAVFPGNHTDWLLIWL